MSSISTILGAYNLYGFTNYTFEVTELDGVGGDVVTKYLTREAADFGSLARAFCLTYLKSVLQRMMVIGQVVTILLSEFV